jgi:hypothetical protein
VTCYVDCAPKKRGRGDGSGLPAQDRLASDATVLCDNRLCENGQKAGDSPRGLAARA